MALELTANTRLCVSLASRPGVFGGIFHNYLYGRLGLDFVYKACTTTRLGDALTGVRALGIRGCGLSMPFKREALPFLDEVDEVARAIGAVNTVVNDGGVLRGFNTDHLAVRARIAGLGLPPADARVLLLGSGGMARASARALRDLGFRSVLVVARDPREGPAVASAFGGSWKPALDPGMGADLLINATSLGMGGGGTAVFPDELLGTASAVVDAVAQPKVTELIERARTRGLRTVTGFELAVEQARHQFLLYTGQPVDDALLEEVARHCWERV